MIEIVTGSLIEAKEKYICHQTNCVTKRAAHLAKTVFQAFPYSDIYTDREAPDKPGSIIIRGDGKDQRYVINMLGQYFPGSSKYTDSELDGTSIREKYFHRCLSEISKIPTLESVAFPFKIGCGAANGVWSHYYDLLIRFADYVEKQQGTKVVIYQLPE